MMSGALAAPAAAGGADPGLDGVAPGFGLLAEPLPGPDPVFGAGDAAAVERPGMAGAIAPPCPTAPLVPAWPVVTVADGASDPAAGDPARGVLSAGTVPAPPSPAGTATVFA